MNRGWARFFLVPLLVFVLALTMGLLAKLRVIRPDAGGPAIGVLLFVGLPALAGGLYGAELGPEGEPRWLGAVFGSWPPLLLMILAMAGFRGATVLVLFYGGFFVFFVASVSGALTHVVQLLRTRRPATERPRA